MAGSPACQQYNDKIRLVLSHKFGKAGCLWARSREKTVWLVATNPKSWLLFFPFMNGLVALGLVAQLELWPGWLPPQTYVVKELVALFHIYSWAGCP